MKKLAFLITTWLVHVNVICSSNSFEKTEEDMERIFNSISEEMLLSLTKSLSVPLDRQKRELPVEKQSVDDDSGVFRLASVKPVSRLCHPAVQTLFLDVSNTTYAVCVSAATSNDPAEVVVGYYRENTWTPFHRWFVNNPVHAAAFYTKHRIYVLVADNDKQNGTELLKINLATNSLTRDHDVTSNYATSIAVWNMKNNGHYNLAIANSVGSPDAADMSSEVFVYEWTGTYFDRYASFRAYDVKDVEPFHIHEAAYMAVANFRRGKNNPRVDSEILRYDMDGNKWVSHQKMRTFGAMDWEFFTLGTSLGQEFFLAVANKGNGEANAKSMIYKFVEDKFVPFQCLPTTEATSIASFSNGDMFILAVANEDDAVHLYQYDGWRFVKTGVQLTRGAMSDGAVHLEFHGVTRNSENVLILSVSNPKHGLYQSVFEIGFIHENPLREWHTKSTEWCLNTLSEIESTDIDKTIGSFDDVIFTDQENITINGDVVFEKGFVANKLKTPKLTEVTQRQVFDNSLLNKLADLQRRLEIVSQKLDEFSDVLKNSLKIEGNQTITSRLEFQDASFDCSSHSCHFENISTSVLNGESIVDWLNNLVFLDSDQFINGTLMARAVNASSIHVFGLIDGVGSQNLVTKSGNHLITGYKTFKNLVTAQDIGVAGKVDGVIISPSNVLVTTGHQTVSGQISFDEIETSWLSSDYVNGRNFTEFYNDLILTDKSYTITGEKTMSDVTIDELVMTPGSTINGVDIVDLWLNTLWTNGNQEIKAEITFSDVAFKNLKITGGINGVQIPGPSIVDITEPTHFTAPQVFKNSTKIASLEILESINGISLVQTPDGSQQLDIMMKTGDQIVTGAKTFHTIHLYADSDVKGTVDGVDLSEFKASVLRKNVSAVTNGTWVFNNLVVKGPLTVKGKISGVSLEDVYRRALKLNETEIPEIIFKERVEIKDLQSNNINGINVRSDLVLKNEHQVLTGNKIFEEVVLEENASVLGLINNMNFSFLNDILLRIGNQRIKSKVFKRNVMIRNLVVKGSINGVTVADIVTLKGGQIFDTRILKNVTFNNIEAKTVEVTGRVNNIVLKEMIDDTMTYDGKEVVTGVKDIKGTVYISNGMNLETGDLNGIDLKALWDDAVLVDVPQQISGLKTFTDSVVFDKLFFEGAIDGVSDWEMRYNWMLTDLPQTVEGNVIFENGFSAKDLKVNTVNHLDLKRLEAEIVKLNEATEIMGTVLFDKSVVSGGNVTLTGKIQGVDLSEEAVLRDNIVVTGEKRFHEDLVIEGDLTVDGLIDGIDIEDLCNKTFLTNKDVNISRLIIKGDVTLLEEGSVGGSIAGVDLSQFKEIAVDNKGPEIKFGGVKTFKNLTLAGPVTLEGKFGRVDLNQLVENYMSVTRNQEIPAKMTFDDLSFEGLLSVVNFDTATKEINNINIQELNDKILRTSGTQTVTAPYHIDEAHFASDVFVTGKVNGLELPSGVMRHNHTNYIQSPKIFEQVVVVQGDLEMEHGKTIQDVDVSDWFQKAVLNHGKFNIHGLKTLNKLHLNDVKVEGMFDGLKISEDSLLLTYGDQAVTGRKIINGSVSVEGSLTVNGLINGINLTSLASTTLQRDRNNTITGLKYFTQPLTIISLQAPTVAGVDIIKLEEKLNTTVDLSHLENQLGEIEGVAAHMQIAFDNQAVLLQYYELFDEFDVAAYDWLYVSSEDCGELLMVSDISSSTEHCSSIRIYGYDKSLESFVPARQELITSYAVSVKSLKLNNLTHLFVANRNPCCSCSGSSDAGKTLVDIYAWGVEEFTKLQSVEIGQPIDMLTFKDGNLTCLVVLEIKGSKVYCASENSLHFMPKEVLLTRGQKASILHSPGKIILAVVSEDTSYVRQTYMEGQTYIDIYLWSSSKAEFSAPKQSIQSTFVRSIALMNQADGISEKVFLAIAQDSIPRIHNEPKIIIYRYEEFSNRFEKYQEIKDYGVLEWITLTTGELIFFAVDSQQGLIKVYQLKGVSGFVKINAIKDLGISEVRAFIRSDPEDRLNHYLALVRNSCRGQGTQDVFYADILKSKLKGKRPVYGIV